MNFLTVLMPAICLLTFLMNFSSNLWVIGGVFLAGLITVAGRIFYLSRQEKKKVSTDVLDFRKLRELRLPQMGVWLKENVRGHNEVVDDVVRQLRGNIQLAKPGRCLGSFLLVGPTGTGKSFLAQLISESIFPNVPPLILRMNQFKSADDVFTLLGPPPGRAGFELGGALTRPVAEQPFRVIVLDELEKAHPDIFDCLYDIIDTATCREKSTGNLIDFSGCVFFATSNASVEELRRVREKVADPALREAGYRDALSSNFNKAFIARWERVYFFDTLSEVHVAEVACLNITKYWRQFNLEVQYASPALLLQTVLKNREFKEFGVRQLMSFIRQKSDPVVQSAKSMGLTKVLLDVNPKGEFILASPRKAPYGTSKKVA